MRRVVHYLHVNERQIDTL